MYRSGSIIADYDVMYTMEAMVSQTEEILQYINNTALPILAEQTINGSAIDKDYLYNEVQNEIKNQSESSSTHTVFVLLHNQWLLQLRM